MGRYGRDGRGLFLAALAGMGIMMVQGGDVRGGFITGVTSTGGGGTTTSSAISTISPGNDNSIGASPNLIGIQQNFTTLAPIDLTFTFQDSTGRVGKTTEYFVTQTVTNNTSETWTGFKFLLGFGTGGSFVIGKPGNSLDFDFPTYDPTPTSTAFTNHSTLPAPLQFTSLTWSGGSVLPGQTITFTFSIDVPNRNQIWPQGAGEFTLRALPGLPHAPEPGTLTLSTLAIVGFLGYGWHRRKRN